MRALTSLILGLIILLASFSFAIAQDTTENTNPENTSADDPDELEHPPLVPLAPISEQPQGTPPGAEKTPQSDTLVAPTNPDPDAERKKQPEAGKVERSAQSDTLYRETAPDKNIELSISPELFVGGFFSNYKDLGNFNWVDFGGSIGFIYLEDWFFKLHVRALTEEHQYTGQATGLTTKHRVWFIQPSAQAMYRLAHFKSYHYFVPMDLFAGIKLGGNIFLVDSPFGERDDEGQFLWGIILMPRFYIAGGFGMAPFIEASTINYFADYFINYGVGFFWDFEVLGPK